MHAYETRILFTILIAAAVLALVLVFFIVTILKHQKRKMATEKDKLVAEISLLENERERIAADLHDDLGSLISAIKINLECLQVTDKQDREIVSRTGGYIDITMHKVREIANNLAPKSLRQDGLLTAVKELAEMIGNRGLLQITCQCEISELILAQEKKVHIYRIIQEIVNNIVKHAGASVAIIRLTVQNNHLVIDITDNGIGFDAVEAGKKNAGSGLYNIMRRVDLLQGNIYLDSSPGAGAHYTINIRI